MELIATFFFIFLTTGTTITWNINHPPSTELISLSFGFSIATLAMCSLHLSGGHINPAVTIAMMAIRKVTILRGVTYVIFQVVGGELIKRFNRQSYKVRPKIIGPHKLYKCNDQIAPEKIKFVTKVTCYGTTNTSRC